MTTPTSTTNPFAGRLLPGEKIIWHDRPRQGLMLTPRDGLLIPFSLLWGGFAVFWESSVLRAPNAPIFMMLWGIPFVLAGLFFIFGRFLVDIWVRSKIFYALTDRRVLILRTRPSVNFQSINLDRLPEATLSESSDGRGTIRFGAQASAFGGFGNRGGYGSWIAALDPTPQFLAIEDAQKVFAAVQERSNIASPAP